MRTVTVVSAVAGVALAGGLAFADGLGTPTPAPSATAADTAASDVPSDLAEVTSQGSAEGIELPTGDPDPQRSDAPGDEGTTGTGTEPSDDDEREGNRDADEDREGNRDANDAEDRDGNLDDDNGGRAAPAIANAYLRETATAEVLESCREANGTNKNLANWRGKLISAVAREFRGQSFGPDEEHVVTDFVEGRC